MTCLPGIAPSSCHYHHARLGVDKYAGLREKVSRVFADSESRYGHRRIKAALKTGVSEKAVRGIMAEGARPLVHSDRGRHYRWPGVARAHGTV
nr:IS3 family transposase [Bifidobacterium breve]